MVGDAANGLDDFRMMSREEKAKKVRLIFNTGKARKPMDDIPTDPSSVKPVNIAIPPLNDQCLELCASRSSA